MVPVFCSAGTLEELHRRLGAALDGHGIDAEILFVDDASPDDSWAVVTGLAAADRRVRGIRLAANVRQTRAIFAGLERARAERFVVLDADLDDPPEVVPILVAALDAGHDLVVTSRSHRGRSAGRRVGAAVVNLIARTAGVPGTDVGTSFLAFERHVEQSMRRELEATGGQLILPAAFSASRRWTTIPVGDAGTPTAPSSYPTVVLARMAAAFAVRVLARRVTVASGAVAATATVGGLRAGRARRPLLVVALLGAGAAVAAHAAATVVARRPPGPLSTVAEEVGGQPAAVTTTDAS